MRWDSGLLLGGMVSRGVKTGAATRGRPASHKKIGAIFVNLRGSHHGVTMEVCPFDFGCISTTVGLWSTNGNEIFFLCVARFTTVRSLRSRSALRVLQQFAP